jgi:hypothetical protein
MSEKEREFLDALRNQSIEAVAEILGGVQRLKTMYEEITDDGSGTPVPRPKLGDHFYQLAKFELEHASTLIRLGNSQAEMVFDHLRQLARRTQKTSVTVLELEHRDPHDYVGVLGVRNPFDKPADMRCELGDLKDAIGAVSELKLTASAQGSSRVAPYETLKIDVGVSSKAPVDGTLFGEITVFLSADIEKRVAHRMVKLQHEPKKK